MKISPKGEGTGKKKGKKKQAHRLSFTRLLFIAACWFSFFGFLTLGYFIYDLPPIDGIEKIARKPYAVIKSKDGQIVASYGEHYGELIPADKMPKNLVNAVVATEDRRFFSHPGIDIFGIARAFYANQRAGRVVQGGSTITQQLAKNVFLDPNRTLKRKIQEAILALWLEMRYSKKEILSTYLNRMYLGAGCYGVDAAAQRYFGKSAKDLNLAESAMIIGLLKAPSSYSPTNNEDVASRRTAQVIRNMEDAGMLDEEEASREIAGLSKNLVFTHGGLSAYYFADLVMSQVPALARNSEEDLIVTTTLDTRLQELASEKLSAVLEEQGSKLKASQGALVSMTPGGEILALVGGKNYRESQYNRATQAQRQPGSAFKLFVYLAGLESGMSPYGLFEDRPVTIGNWSPDNYGDSFTGGVTMEEAFARSINTVAVQVSEEAGRIKVVAMAKRLGIASPLNAYPAIALGAAEVNLLEMTRAYAHLANDGRMVEPFAILEIKTKKGKTLYKHEANPSPVILSAGVVGSMNQMLEAVIARGTGTAAAIGRPAGGKTGTSQDFRDAWFLGFTGSMVTGVWVGNDDNSPMKKVTGGKLPARIWHDYMLAAHEGFPVIDIPRGSPPASEGEGLFGLIPGLGGDSSQAGSGEPDKKDVKKEGKDDRESFWDKILSGFESEEGVKHEYPEPKRD